MNNIKKWFILVIFLVKSAQAGTTFSTMGIKEDPKKQEIKNLLKIEKDKINKFKKDNAENEKQRQAKERANFLKSKNNGQLLFAAGNYGTREVKELLKKEGIDIETRNGFNETPLMIAARRGHVKIVRELIKSKADINASSGSRSSFSRGPAFTVLDMAIHSSSLAVVQELIKAKVNIKANPKELLNAYWINPYIVHELLEAGFDFKNIQDSYKESFITMIGLEHKMRPLCSKIAVVLAMVRKFAIENQIPITNPKDIEI